jgi:DNA-binding transcriptional LysR family regulator
MTMDLRDVEYFAVIAEHGHIGRAAETLGLSQPALSLSLRRLEQSAQTKLLTRTAKGVVLTPTGSALLQHVHVLRLARDDLAREIADVARGRAGNLRIGTGPAIAEGFLPQACSELLSSAPRVTLSITVAATTDTLLTALHSGDLDLVVNHIGHAPRHRFVFEPLWQDEFVIYAATNHRLARRRSVTLAELAHERWACTSASAFTTRQSLKQIFEEHGLAGPQLALVSDSVMLRHRTVASTDLLGIGSRRIVEANASHLDLKIISVKDATWIRPVAAVYRKDGYLPPAASHFMQMLKAAAERIAKEV